MNSKLLAVRSGAPLRMAMMPPSPKPLSELFSLFFKQFAILHNPLLFWYSCLYPLPHWRVAINTPVGKIKIKIRNRQTLRAIWSVFVGQGYKLDLRSYCFLDVGSNIGVTALYFLTRNKNNKIVCIEPDPHNIPFLKDNLRDFSNRSIVLKGALVDNNCPEDMLRSYLSKDGKYSSLFQCKLSFKAIEMSAIKVKSIDDCLKQNLPLEESPFIIKLDIEGTADLLIKALEVTCEKYSLYKLFAEGHHLKIQALRSSIYSREILNGYITLFTDRRQDC